MASYAYCPSCGIEGGPNAFVVANPSHLELVQKSHNNWAGKNYKEHELIEIEGEIPNELKPLLVFGMLAGSSVPLVTKN